MIDNSTMKNPVEIIKEMFGRITPNPGWLNATNWMNKIYNIESIDYSKTDYALTKAIYYASVVKGSDGRLKGKNMQLAAVFGKPIVNAAASFAFSQNPIVKVTGVNGSNDKDGIKAAQSFIEDWLAKNSSKVFDLARWSLRDGDHYVRLNEKLQAVLIPADRTEINVDPISGDITSYTVSVRVKNKNNRFDKYVSTYEKGKSVKIMKYEDENDKGTEVTPAKTTETTVKADATETTDTASIPLEIVGFHNEKESGQLYGNSEYQNVYYHMANYHEVLEKAIKNNLFNSTSIPYVKGIDDAEKFLRSYGKLQNDGKYKLVWDANNILFGGEKFEIKTVQGVLNAEDADKLLNLLFWLICQGSETPEFVMGTALQSSKASVSEQMPVMIRKAMRKQTEYKEYYHELFELVFYKARKMGESVPEKVEFTVTFPSILDDDLKLNIEIVKTLSEEGIISDHTKMILLSMQQKVDDVDAEIKIARAEGEERQKKADIYGQQEQDRIQKELDSKKSKKGATE